MGKKYLIDTNIVIDYLGNKLPKNARTSLDEIIDDQINLSVINKIELLGFLEVDKVLIDFVVVRIYTNLMMRLLKKQLKCAVCIE